MKDIQNQEIELEEGVDRFWYATEAFLRATADISKIFWPPKPLDASLVGITNQRGKDLRRVFGVKDDSPLRSRTLRDHFEHFDERIDLWYASSTHHNIIDSNLFPRRFLDKSIDYLRNFDPEEWVLFFAGDELSLKPLIEAVEELAEKTRVPTLDNANKEEENPTT